MTQPNQINPMYKPIHLQAMTAEDVRSLALHAKQAYALHPSEDNAAHLNRLVEIYNFKVGKLEMRGVAVKKEKV